jgi:hypothetical protein
VIFKAWRYRNNTIGAMVTAQVFDELAGTTVPQAMAALFPKPLTKCARND